MTNYTTFTSKQYKMSLIKKNKNAELGITVGRRESRVSVRPSVSAIYYYFVFHHPLTLSFHA